MIEFEYADAKAAAADYVCTVEPYSFSLSGLRGAVIAVERARLDGELGAGRQDPDDGVVSTGCPGMAPTTYRAGAFTPELKRHFPLVRATDEERAKMNAQMIRLAAEKDRKSVV